MARYVDSMLKVQIVHPTSDPASHLIMFVNNQRDMIHSVETEAYDEMTWEPIWTPELLMKLGTTGEGNIIATITDATPADQIVGLPLGNQ